MSQFLFVVEIPPMPNSTFGSPFALAWTDFLREAEPKIPNNISKNRIAPNVWLIPAENALPLIATLCGLADKFSLKYSSLLLSGDVSHLTKP